MIEITNWDNGGLPLAKRGGKQERKSIAAANENTNNDHELSRPLEVLRPTHESGGDKKRNVRNFLVAKKEHLHKTAWTYFPLDCPLQVRVAKVWGQHSFDTRETVHHLRVSRYNRNYGIPVSTCEIVQMRSQTHFAELFGVEQIMSRHSCLEYGVGLCTHFRAQDEQESYDRGNAQKILE